MSKLYAIYVINIQRVVGEGGGGMVVSYRYYLYPRILQIMVADRSESQLWMHAGRHDVVFGE